MSNIIIDNVLKNATADNIESSLEFFSLLVEKLNELKRKFDLEAPKHPRACKSSKIYKPTYSDDEEDDDSSSDYVPDTDSDDASDDDDDDDDDE